MVSCLAVGAAETPGSEVSMLGDVWRNGRWRLVHVPEFVIDSENLADVFCAAPTRCVVVGQAGIGLNSNPRIRAVKLDHGRWADLPVPHIKGQAGLLDVTCASDASCIAVGFSAGSSAARSHPMALSWNG